MRANFSPVGERRVEGRFRVDAVLAQGFRRARHAADGGCGGRRCRFPPVEAFMIGDEFLPRY